MDPMRYVYGPVPSRRLGRSLGVSPIPHKTCTCGCVYCQLGRTNDLTIVRRRFFPPDDIIAEVGDALGRSGVDTVTFAGDGEPTLSSDLGLLVREVKARWGKRVAVITNGTLLQDPRVREELMAADVLLVSLDAGTAPLWRRIKRPHPDLAWGRVLKGIADIVPNYDGELRLEVMLVRGLNDTDSALRDLWVVLDVIGADHVDLLVPTRPPAEPWAGPPEPGRVLHAARLLGADSALSEDAEWPPAGPTHAPARDIILSIGARHPLKEGEARAIERAAHETGTVDSMLAAGELVRAGHRGETYLLLKHSWESHEEVDGHGR